MSTRIAGIVNDSAATQSDSDEADCCKGDGMQSSHELGRISGSEHEKSQFCKDVPSKSGKKMRPSTCGRRQIGGHGIVNPLKKITLNKRP